ncbi:MAG: 3-oxoacyl-ACP synthase [Desulfitibacter sp. BRH_c19]|nr:MAG: 3-oxoacyl-ACP synthase [Desulfitibacter sp. BRH_c19]
MENKYRAKIVGVGMYLPEKIVTNKCLETTVDTNDEWIKSRTGIEERRVVEDDLACSDLGAKAALKAMERAKVTPEDIDLIIVATLTGDMVWPSTACLIQEKIGAYKAAAYDLSAGCTGFIYGLTTATQFIETGYYKNVLVIGAEVMSKIVNWDDRNTCILFGDGAGAVVLQPSQDSSGILANYLGSDGRGAHLLKQPAGGSSLPPSYQTIDDKMHTIHMNGNEVFKFAVRVMGEASLKVLEMAGVKKEEVDLFIPHQANIRIVEAATKRLNLSPERVVVNLNKYGNMSSASIPVALNEAYENNRICAGQKVLLVGFGAGLTWGATLIQW